MSPDRLNLNFADERSRGADESGVTFGESTHADESSVAQFFADQFEALAGNNHVGGGKAQDEKLKAGSGLGAWG